MAKSKSKNSVFNSFPFRLLLVTTFAALLLLGIKNILTDYQYSNVLGASSYQTTDR